MTDKKFNRKAAFAFLADVKKSLLDYYTTHELERAQAYQLTTFPETLSDKIVSGNLSDNTGILQQRPSRVQ